MLSRFFAVFFLCLFLMTAAEAESGLTLYGTLDAGFAYSRHSESPDGRYSPQSSVGLISGGQSGNRFGVKGVEDLGSGQALKFQLENGFNIGNGTAGQSRRLFGRQAWIGYENQVLGQLWAGRMNNFASDYTGPLTPFTGQYGSASFGMSFGTANAERLSNMLKFETPKLAGFKFGAGYSFATGMTSGYAQEGKVTVLDASTREYNYSTNNNLRSLSLGANYSSGPFYLMATYDSFYPNTLIADKDYKNASAWILGGYYDFAVAKVSAAYGQTRNGAANSLQNILGIVRNDTFDNTNSSIIFDESFAVNSYMVAVSLPATSFGQFFAAWQMAKPSQNMQASSTYPISTQRVVSLGYTYSVTRRTSVYSYAGYALNASLIEGLTSGVVAVGLTHKF